MYNGPALRFSKVAYLVKLVAVSCRLSLVDTRAYRVTRVGVCVILPYRARKMRFWK
jgi:hypothetical protein